MSKSLELDAVVAHFKKLTLEAIQQPADVKYRRELLDRYFIISTEVMESPITPKQVTEACDCSILFIDYSLMPETPFSAGLNDCLHTYKWLRVNGPF
jgi:hypothetical protein